MADRTCTKPGCSKPHRAKGLCSTCYNRANPRLVEVACAACGKVTSKEPGTKYANRFCSLMCRDMHRLGLRGEDPTATNWIPLLCRVPLTHPSRASLHCKVPAMHPSRRAQPVERDCGWCGSRFITSKAAHIYCTRECKTRHMKVRRRGQECGSPTAYTWTEVITVFLRFDSCCAYCEQRIEQPEPDHVIPLSRGGSNGIGNILPSCSSCNSDKRQLLLHEWNADRARRGLSPRVTEWADDDHRVGHLLWITRKSMVLDMANAA